MKKEDLGPMPPMCEAEIVCQGSILAGEVMAYLCTVVEAPVSVEPELSLAQKTLRRLGRRVMDIFAADLTMPPAALNIGVYGCFNTPWVFLEELGYENINRGQTTDGH